MNLIAAESNWESLAFLLKIFFKRMKSNSILLLLCMIVSSDHGIDKDIANKQELRCSYFGQEHHQFCIPRKIEIAIRKDLNPNFIFPDDRTTFDEHFQEYLDKCNNYTSEDIFFLLIVDERKRHTNNFCVILEYCYSSGKIERKDSKGNFNSTKLVRIGDCCFEIVSGHGSNRDFQGNLSTPIIILIDSFIYTECIFKKGKRKGGKKIIHTVVEESN